MRTIPSPHGGLLHHEHDQHDGAPRERDRRSGHRHFRRHSHGPGLGRGERIEQGERHGRGHGFGHDEGVGRGERRGRGHGRGHGFGRGRSPLTAGAPGREGVHELAHVSQEIRGALRNLLHRGTPDQLAEAQRLLEDTRRSLYLILATEPESAATEPESAATEPEAPASQPEPAIEADTPLEIG